MSAPRKTFTAADLRDCASLLTEAMKDPNYEACYYSVLVKMEGPPQPNLLLAAMEKLQVNKLDELGYPDGDKALGDLKGAVRRFPQDQELRALIVELCEVEEAMMNRVQKKRCEELGIKLLTREEQETAMKKQQAMMKMMQDAMASLPKERQQRMMEITNNMRQGKQPSAEEQAYAMESRQMMQAYVETMQEMMAEAAGEVDDCCASGECSHKK